MFDGRPIGPGWRFANSAALWALVALTIATTAGLSVRSLNRLADTRETVSHQLRIHTALASLMSHLLTAETAQRGFLLSGKTTYLQPYFGALVGVRHSREELAGALGRTPTASLELGVLDAAIAAKLAVLDRAVRLKSEGRVDEAINLVVTDAGTSAMSAVEDALMVLATDVDTRATVELAGTNRELRVNYVGLGISIALNVLLVVGVALRLRRATVERSAARDALETRNSELAQTNLQVHRLSDLNRLMQTCLDTEEAVRLLQYHLPPLVGAESGALYLMAASRDQLSRAFAWGPEDYTEHFDSSECWAIRLGQVFRQPADAGTAGCKHLELEAGGGLQGMQCMPLLAQGELSGVLVLSIAAGGADPAGLEGDSYRRVVLEQVGLALGNLKLRYSLRQQSIRDVLTGLVNRRFLEESMQREVLRASRMQEGEHPAGMAVLMLDVDHFKRVNDEYGHEVGDQVLRRVAQVLIRQTRGSDVAARYGGEEFAIVLTDITAELALERAEQIRAAVEQVALPVAGRAEGAVTISIGLAQFPTNGTTMEGLLLAADTALYEAKHAGRNRVVVASRAGAVSAQAIASNAIAAAIRSGNDEGDVVPHESLASTNPRY